MNGSLEIKLGSEHVHLLFQRALFRPAYNQLVLSDLHLGKAAHFRSQGIAMPAQSHLRDHDRLLHLLRTWRPASVLILGDLFHSRYNREWLWFQSLVKEHANVQFILVLGNHDVLDEKIYSLANVLVAHEIEEDELLFSHAPLPATRKINVCGHIHPGIRITGAARQSITLPCFYRSQNTFILPAFGILTGLYLMDRDDEADFYVVTHETVVKL